MKSSEHQGGLRKAEPTKRKAEILAFEEENLRQLAKLMPHIYGKGGKESD